MVKSINNPFFGMTTVPNFQFGTKPRIKPNANVFFLKAVTIRKLGIEKVSRIMLFKDKLKSYLLKISNSSAFLTSASVKTLHYLKSLPHSDEPADHHRGSPGFLVQIKTATSCSTHKIDQQETDG